MNQCDDIAWALCHFADEDVVMMDTYHDYLDGKHPLPFELASDSYGKAFRTMLAATRENLCPAVIGAPAERLAIIEWSGSGEAAYLAMGGNRLANRVHREALVAGRAFVLAWPPASGTKAHMHKGDSMCVRVSEEDEDVIDLAAKLWLSGKKWRLNLYYTDRCERLVADVLTAGGMPKPAKFAEYADASPAVIGYRFVVNGKPIVPVIPFVNGGEPGEEGRSELRDVLPIQNALNKSFCDVMIGSEFSALPKRVFTGVSGDRDPVTGESEIEKASKKASGGGLREMYLANPDAKAINLQGADVAQLVEVTDALELKVAKVTGTPLHYFLLGSGQFPSGEALRTAETRLIARVVDMQQDFGPAWSQLMALMGTPSDPKWADAASLTEAERMTALKVKKELGVPQATIWRELGYDDTEIARMKSEQPTLDAFSAAMSAGV